MLPAMPIKVVSERKTASKAAQRVFFFFFGGQYKLNY